jgi:CrcB protein
MTLPGLRTAIAISLGAIPGALGRHYLSRGLVSLTGITNFPIGTLGVNLLGCFLLGSLVTITMRRFTLSPDMRLLVITGFIGSFTTFSAYELDIAHLAEARQWWLEAIYWLGSPILGLLCLQVGMALGRRLSAPMA